MELFSIRIQRTFQLVSTSLGWWHQDFPDHFTYGGRTGVHWNPSISFTLSMVSVLFVRDLSGGVSVYRPV